jgi:hypothetical protein
MGAAAAVAVRLGAVAAARDVLAAAHVRRWLFAMMRPSSVLRSVLGDGAHTVCPAEQSPSRGVLSLVDRARGCPAAAPGPPCTAPPNGSRRGGRGVVPESTPQLARQILQMTIFVVSDRRDA